MKILVAGAGAVGCQLAALGNNPAVQLSFYDPDAVKVAALQRRGIRLVYPSGAACYLAAIADVLPEEPQDAIVVAAKTSANEVLLPALRPVVGPQTLLLTVQNGWGNCEALAALYGEEKVLAAAVYFGGYQGEEYEIISGGSGGVKIAPWHPQGKPSPAQQQAARQIAALLLGCGLQAEYVADAAQMLWQKLIINSVINPLTAFYEVENGAVLRADLWPQAQALLRESIAVANACGQGFGLAEMRRALRQTATATAHNHSSMLFDWQRGTPWELETINGQILQLAAAKGIAVETHRQLAAALRAKAAARQNRR